MVRQEDERVLGRETRGPIGAEQLDTVPWNHAGADAVVEYSTSELTAICPVTRQPDF
ncbi:MAG: NADPH-dependent 7-cyano-7-deazaguanine reductase QueF, partial [Rubrobacteraceae bacterium]|nr:NADPH-dependent 7-cyano-7-deazaguanine reductase QueF [Rubrobacteraceae bacterium]